MQHWNLKRTEIITYVRGDIYFTSVEKTFSYFSYWAGSFPGYFLKYGKFSQARKFWWIRLNLMKLIHLKSKLKCDCFDVTIGIKFPFLEFWLLLSRVAPYYSSLPLTVWKKHNIHFVVQNFKYIIVWRSYGGVHENTKKWNKRKERCMWTDHLIKSYWAGLSPQPLI